MPEYRTPQAISVVLELRVAGVRVAAGDREDTVVEVRPSDGSNRDDVNAAAQTRVEYADGRLLVSSPRRLREWSPFGDGGSIDVQIGLPNGSELIGRAAVGTFRCAGTLGRCELRSSAGEIRLERAAAVKLVTAGDIVVERATGNAELTTATGEVRAGAIDGAAVIKNSNGDVHIGEVRGELRVRSADGDVEVERCHDSLTAVTANGDIRVGTVGGGSVVASTGRGGSRSGSPTASPRGSTCTRRSVTCTAIWTPPTDPSQARSGSKCAPGPGSATSRSADASRRRART